VSLEVIEDAEKNGLLRPYTGSRIFEGTVGSTGISIATIARARCVFTFIDPCMAEVLTRRGYDASMPSVSTSYTSEYSMPLL